MIKLRRRFANRLKTLRTRNQLTQEDLAKKIHRSVSFISGLERGIDAPSFETLERIAAALHVEIKDLFEFELSGPRKRPEK